MARYPVFGSLDDWGVLGCWVVWRVDDFWGAWWRGAFFPDRWCCGGRGVVVVHFLVARRTLVFIPGAHFSSRLPIRAVPLLTLFGELLRDSRFLIRAALSFLLIGYSFGECLFDIVCVCVFECAIIYG